MMTDDQNESNKKRENSSCLYDGCTFTDADGCNFADSDGCNFVDFDGCNLGDLNGCNFEFDGCTDWSFDGCTTLVLLPMRWIVIAGLMLYGDWDYQNWTLKN